MQDKKLLGTKDARALYALMRDAGIYPAETQTTETQTEILTNCNAIEAYMFMNELDMVTLPDINKVATDYDPIQSALYKIDNVTTLYNVMRKYNMLHIAKSDFIAQCVGASVMAGFNLDTYTVYRLFKGIALDALIVDHNDMVSFDVYKFYKYDLFGNEFKFKKFTIDTMHTVFSLIRFKGFNYMRQQINVTTEELRSIGESNKVNSCSIYTFYKSMTSVKKPKNRAGVYHNINDTPRDIKRGLVSVDYYISKDDKLNKDSRLARDRLNNTQPHQNVSVVDVLPTLFKKQIKTSDKARHTINVYNSRCVALINKIDATKKQIIYAKSGNIKIALYAIIWRQNEKAFVVYFNIKSDVAYTIRYSFKNNKASKYDLVKLSHVKDTSIMVYADTITDGYKKRKTKHQKAIEKKQQTSVK